MRTNKYWEEIWDWDSTIPGTPNNFDDYRNVASIIPLERRELEWLLKNVDWSEVYYIDPVLYFDSHLTRGIKKVTRPKSSDNVSMILFEIETKPRWNGNEWITRVRSFLEISKRDNDWFWVYDKDPDTDTFNQAYKCDGFLGVKKLLAQLLFLKTEDDNDED